MPLGIPEKVMVPVTFDPICVSCQVIVPIPDWPIIPPVPRAAVVESTPVPDQVPAAVMADPGAVGEFELLLQAAVSKPTNAALINALVIVPPI